MQQPHNNSLSSAAGGVTGAVRLFIYGSCESDQYCHPGGQSESKRPICLSEIQQFDLEEEDPESGRAQILLNPLFKAEVLKIACGALHTVVVTVQGLVYTFGCNDEGALGRQGVEKVPGLVVLPEAIDLVSAGDNHSVFANSVLGCVYFTGNYKYMRGQSMSTRTTEPIRYQVGHLDSRMRNKVIKKVVSGSNHSAILIDGRIFIRGQPQAHTVGRRINQRHKVRNSLTFDSVGLTHVQELWCGGYHSVAKVRKGGAWWYYAWGLNKHGQLGVRSYEESPYPQEVRKLRGKNVVEVAAGTNFTIVLTEEGEMWGCGQNDDGQLGLGEDYVYEDSEAEEELGKDLEDKMSLLEKEKVEEKAVEQGQKVEKDQNNNDNAHKEEAQAQEKVQEHVQNQEKVVHVQIKAVVEVKVDVPVQSPKQQAPVRVMEVQSPIAAIKKLKEQNIYIKSLKRIPTDQKLDRISAGSQFCFGWNASSLYSWGFGSNFVLLTGSQQDECTPFKVKPRILNEQSIYELAAGAQHVVYLSYPTNQTRPELHWSQAAVQRSQQGSRRLSRKKKI